MYDNGLAFIFLSNIKLNELFEQSMAMFPKNLLQFELERKINACYCYI